MADRDDDSEYQRERKEESIQPKRKPGERDSFGEPLDLPTGDRHTWDDQKTAQEGTGVTPPKRR